MIVKKYATIAACLFSICTLLVFSSPVNAASNAGVVYAASSSSSDYVGITIDGNYSDWSDKPSTAIYYSAGMVHHGSLFRDANYVYLHILMSANGYSSFNGSNYCFSVDGKDTYVAVLPSNGQNIIYGNTPLEVRLQNGYTLVNNAAGVLTHKIGLPDEWEIKIPLSLFSSNPGNISTISFTCSNLGSQALIATGTSTLPFVIACVGMVFAAAGIKLSKRKNAG
jgi:uncharacterized protein (TIGR04145 family)